MEVARSTETSVNLHEFTRRHNPQYWNLHQYRYTKPHIWQFYLFKH